jgi:hypothetical protein
MSQEELSSLKHRELQKICRERYINSYHMTKQAMIAAIVAKEHRLQQEENARRVAEERRVKNFEKAKVLYRFWSQTGGQIPDDGDNKLGCRMCKFLVTGIEHDGYCSDYDERFDEEEEVFHDIEPYVTFEFLSGFTPSGAIAKNPPELEELSKSETGNGQNCHQGWCRSGRNLEAVEIIPFYNPAFIGHKFSLMDLKNEEDQ